MGRDAKTVQVTLFDRVYFLRTTEEAEYVAGLARNLNERIEAAGNNAGRYSDIQVLSLIALQILDEKEKAEKELEQLKGLAKKMELGRNRK